MHGGSRIAKFEHNLQNPHPGPYRKLLPTYFWSERGTVIATSHIHLIRHAILGIAAFAIIVIVLLGDCLGLLPVHGLVPTSAPWDM